jgi:hypothetical protein
LTKSVRKRQVKGARLRAEGTREKEIKSSVRSEE